MKGIDFTYTSVQSLVLLPAQHFVLQIRGGEVTDVTFAIDDAGQVAFDPADPLLVNSFQGLTRLLVTGPIT